MKMTFYTNNSWNPSKM